MSKNFRNHILTVGMLPLLLLCMVTAGARTGGSRRSLNANRLDTLTLGERFSIRTNTLDWIALTPNLGMEFTLGNKNWHRWTLGVYGRWNPLTNTHEPTYNVYDLADVRGEVRRYWHARNRVRRSFFYGFYATYGSHDIKLSETGYRGTHIALGLKAGTIAPLYGYQNGSHLDLEFALNVGAVLARQEEYQKTEGGYVTTSEKNGFRLNWTPLTYVVANDMLQISFVYHFGPSVANRYSRRIAIDERYRQHLNDVQTRRDSTHRANLQHQQERRDSLEKVDYERRFEKQRLELDKKYINDSLQQVRKMEKLKD